MNILIPALGRINTQNRDGAEIRFIEGAKIWKKMGLNINIVLPPREKKLLQSEGVKINFHVLPEKNTYEGENLFFILLIYLQRLIKTFFFSPPKNMDLIYIPSDFLIDLVPGLWWKKFSPKAKIVVCIFLLAPHPLKGFRYGFQKRYQLPTLRGLLFFFGQLISLALIKLFADHILVLNHQNKKSLERIGFKNKVSVINMGVDLKEFTTLSKIDKIYDACFIGRLHPQKGIFDLIEIWDLVCKRKPKAKLVMIAGGDVNFKNKLLQLIKLKGLEKNIIFLGFKTGKAKIKILKQSLLFTLPSFYESWAMVAAEAMAAGLPVVAYDLPIFPKIFPRGMTRVPLGDKKAFAKMILLLLEKQEIYQKKKKEAEELVKIYEWQKVAQQEIKILEQLVK